MIDAPTRARIAQAVAEAEAATTGEIVCILAQETSRYREVPLGWAAAVALLLPPALAPFGLWPLHWPSAGGADWTTGHAAPSLVSAIEVYALAQVVLFIGVALIVSIAPVRRVLTPGFLKTWRVHKTAMEQFAATGISRDPTRTGVVIFGSLLDRRVEVLSDAGIHAAVGDVVWAKAVTAVQAGMKRGDAGGGFVSAVQLCGAALAEHFPSTGPHANALPDDLLEI